MPLSHGGPGDIAFRAWQPPGDRAQMADHDRTVAGVPERPERHHSRRDAAEMVAGLTRRGALTGGAAGLAAVLLAACGSSAASGDGTGTDAGTGAADTGDNGAAAANPVSAVFGVTGGYRFTFVNHLKDSQVFIPTINGIHDACTLLNCSYQWVGSASNNAADMAAAINAAIGAGVDGIATTLIAPSLKRSVAAAIRAGIPVISYNADEPGTGRLAYVGQDLLASGREAGRRIRRLLPYGGRVMMFLATPGSASVAPRLEGIKQTLAGSGIVVSSQATGASEQQAGTTVATIVSRKLTAYQGYFGLDADSTTAVAQAIARNNLKGKVAGGGFDLSPDSVQLLANGTIQFLLDQQLYLQGFLPVLELFMHRATDGLVGAADVDTGLKVLDRRTVRPYLTTRSRYEGTSTSPGVQRA